MSTRKSRHVRARHLLAAAACGVATFGASQADASLIIDVRATGPNAIDAKHINLSAPGDTITLAVFARVNGTNGINDEQIQSAGGSLSSVGGIRGNISGSVIAPFNGASYTNGSMQDFDSDGDLDLGSAGSGSSGKLFGRSNSVQSTNPVDANTGEIQIAQATFTYTGGSGVLSINWLVRTNATGGPNSTAALWFEDGNNANPAGSVYAAGAPVVIGPEPSTVGLIALSSIGLLARRKRPPLSH